MNEKTNRELQNFCKNIAYLRKKYNYSKSQLASILGTSAKAITRLEQGIIPPTLSCFILVHLDNYFHIPPDAMFSPLEETTSEDTAP